MHLRTVFIGLEDEMRVISQDGCDYPYESIVISHGDGIISARMISNVEERYFLAKYSSEEKAEKAMQKLHECYTGAILLRNVGFPDDAAEQLKSMKSGFICVNNRTDNVRIEPLHMAFRFPQEDEI